jgi:hypothetical protein
VQGGETGWQGIRGRIKNRRVGNAEKGGKRWKEKKDGGEASGKGRQNGQEIGRNRAQNTKAAEDWPHSKTWRAFGRFRCNAAEAEAGKRAPGFRLFADDCATYECRMAQLVLFLKILYGLCGLYQSIF